MLNSYKRYKIKYDQLNNFSFKKGAPYILIVDWHGVLFEFLIRIRNSEKLLILGSGSFDPTRMKPPVFQRHAWIDDFKESLIYYNDPTLYLWDKLTIGWGNGTADRHYLKDVSVLLNKMILKLNYKKNNVYFYGSSAGGFMSLMLAGLIKGTTVIVNNPQTIVTNFYPHLVKQMLDVSYPNLTIEEVKKRYKDRIIVIELYKKVNYVPKIYYLQNISSEKDMMNHLIPFMTDLKGMSEKVFADRLHIQLYADEKQGHNPIGKEETLDYINSIIK
ncbi:glycosyl transferase family 2 [Cytobacillus sp. SAFR-174]|uniref:glycosyl transferase family 2 n=1 Tax=Cytobacillus sp. SAFR-174 TaxID=3436868 RepID=UPI003F7DF424